MAGAASCPFCAGDGGRVVLRTPKWRLVHAGEAAFPGFYRLVWNTHVAEFSDLCAADRSACMEAVATVELALRRHLQPDKVNIAALGNQVPHLHWHVIARHAQDSHFPQPVWAAALRQAPAELVESQQRRLPALEDELRQQLGGHPA